LCKAHETYKPLNDIGQCDSIWEAGKRSYRAGLIKIHSEGASRAEGRVCPMEDKYADLNTHFSIPDRALRVKRCEQGVGYRHVSEAGDWIGLRLSFDEESSTFHPHSHYASRRNENGRFCIGGLNDNSMGHVIRFL
jgi:hypothetical protein